MPEIPSQQYREASKRVLMRYLDLGTLSEENKQLRSLLYDQVTNLPTVSLLLNAIQAVLKKHHQVGVLYLSVEKDTKLEAVFGAKTLDQIMGQVGRVLTSLRGKSFRSNDAVSAVMKSGNAFAILLSPPRERKIIEMKALLEIRKRVIKDIRAACSEAFKPEVSKRLHFCCGAAIIEDTPNMRVEHLVYDALEAARENAQQKELAHKEKQIDQLRLIIEEGNIATLFQPVVNLSSYQIVAYEALSRGPAGELELPEKMFRLAIESDLVWRLDRTCRDRAFLNAKGIKSDFLFVNINPHSIGDPEFKTIAESVYIKHSNLKHNQIIFDLSEQTMADDPDLFRLVLYYFKDLAFQVSIDDVGSGYYSGLELIAKTKPSFVKIDRPLIRSIEKDEVKQDLISTILRFSDKAGSVVCAEGIETKDELKTLQKLRISCGQGFLFSPPAPPFASIKRP